MNRLIALNFGMAAAIAFLFYMGLLDFLLTVPTIYVSSTLLAITALGVISRLVGSAKWARWIANHMTRFGMLGTGVGIVVGLTGLSFTGTNVEIAKELMGHLGYAFLSMILGLCGNIWLNLNARLVDDE